MADFYESIGVRRSEAPAPVVEETPLPQESESGNFMRGFKTSTGQVKPMLQGAAGLVGAVGEKVFGEGGKSTELKDWGFTGYDEGMKKIAPLQRPNDEFTTVWEKAKEGDLGAVVDFLTYAAGYGASEIGQAVVTGGVGSVVGKVAARKLATEFVERSVNKEAAELVAKGMAKDKAEEQAAKEVGKKLGDAGAITAVTANSIASESGSIYGEAREEAGGRDLTGVELARVAGSGLAAGTLETISDLTGFAAVTGRIKFGTGSRAARTARGAAGGAVIEGVATEFPQTVIERFGAGKDLTSDAAIKEYINSTALGTTIGGGAGAVTGALSSSPKEVIADIFDKNKTVEQSAATAAGIIDRIIGDTPANRKLQDQKGEVQQQVDAALKEVAVETSSILEKAPNAAARPGSSGNDVGQTVQPDVLQPAAGVRDPALDPQPPGPGGPGAGDDLNLGGPDSVQPVGNGAVAPADAAVGVQQPPGPDAVATPATAAPVEAPATAKALALPDAVAVQAMNMELAQKAAAEGTTAEAITLVDVATLPANPTRIGGGRITLSQGEAKMLSDYAATFGKRVVIVRGMSSDGVMGANADTVFVNAETQAAHHLVVTAHEVTHHLERDEPELFQQLVDALPSTLTDANLKKYAGSYKRTPEQVASMLADPAQRTALVGELIADLMGNNATRLKGHLEVLAKAKGDPNLIVRVGQFILQFIDRLLKGRSMKEFSTANALAVADLKKARRVFTQVMAEYAVKQTGKQKLAAKVAEVQAKKGVTPVTPATAATVATVEETAEKGPNQAENTQKSTKNEGSGTNAKEPADGADGSSVATPADTVPAQPAGKAKAEKLKKSAKAKQKAKLAAKIEAAKPKNSDVRRSEQRTPGFYSALEELLEKKKFGPMTAVAWKAALKGAQIKDEEIRWTLDPFLDMQGDARINQAVLLDYARNRGVQLREHLKSEEAASRDPLDANDAVDVEALVRDAVLAREIEVDALITSRIERQTRGIRDRAERREMAETLREELRDDPQYEIDEDEIRYEITADIENRGQERATDDLERDPEPALFKTRTVPGGVEYRELVLTLFGRVDENGEPLYMHKNHWENIKNPIAHVRFDTRVINGLKTLFIHELQSDWAQDIRDHRPGKGDDFRPPDAPYTKETEAWTKLLVRRMITYAVQNGHEQVAFATGDQVNDFFSLDKEVDSVVWNEDTQRLKGYWRGDLRADLEEVTQAKLKNHLGEEAASQIVAHRPMPWKGKLGGFGMRHSYDVIVPSNVGKVVRPLGSKLEKVVAELPDRPWVYYTVPSRRGTKVARARSGPDGAEAYFVHDVDRWGNPEGVWGHDSSIAKNFTSERAANKEIARLKALPQPVTRSEQNAFTVSPQMKQAVRGTGFTRFSEQRDESGDETIMGAAGANAEKMVNSMGARLYGEPTKMQEVTVKELYQNSFDAIKAVIERSPGTKGKIRFELIERDRTVQVVDNGIGMSPQTFTKEFIHAFGSLKETKRSSGGFGIAKLLFLYQNDGFEAVTWRDGVLSRMSTHGDAVRASAKDGGAKIPVTVKRNVTRADLVTLAPELDAVLGPDDTGGTSAKVKIPKDFIEPNTREVTSIPFNEAMAYFPSIQKSPLLYDIDVEFAALPEYLHNLGRWDISNPPAGSRFPINDYLPFADVNFSWGAVRIYVTKEETPKTSSPNVEVLSNGIYQFSRRIKIDPAQWNSESIRRKFYLDVSPTVDADSNSYPFTHDRQSFFKPVQEVVEKALFNYLWIAHKKDDLAGSVENFGTVEFVDKDGNTTAGPALAPQVAEGGFEQTSTAIKEGDTVVVRDGQLFVGDAALPELKIDDLKSAQIDYTAFSLPQGNFPESSFAIHDNVEVLVPKDPTSREFVRKPVITALRDEFGARRVNRMLFDIVNTMNKLREVLKSNGYNYDLVKDEGWSIGVSTDIEYHGVSTTVPFKFMGINPFLRDWSGSDPDLLAQDVFGTMVHEFAHVRQRNHSPTGFIPEMQRIFGIVAMTDGNSIANSLRYSLGKNLDILKRGGDYLYGRGDADPKARGRRLEDAQRESVSPEDAGDVAGAGDPAAQASRLPAGAAGERGLNAPRSTAPGTRRALGQLPSETGATQGVGDDVNEQRQQDGSTETRDRAGAGAGPQARLGGDGPGRAGRRSQEPDPGSPGGRAAPGAAAGPADGPRAGGQLPLDGRDEGTNGSRGGTEGATGGPDDLSGETGFQAGVPGQVRFAAQRTAAPGTVWSVDPPETFKVFGRSFEKDKIVRALQNRQVDMVRVQESMIKAGLGISEQADVVQREQAFHGRVSDQYRIFHQTEVANLMQGLKQTGVSQDELSTFLNMRGAEAYNEHINAINPDPAMWDQGSGTHTDDANAYLGNLSPAQRFKYDRLAAIIDRMTKGTREYLVATGLETQETIDAWEAAFPNYTPRHRDEIEGDIGDGTGGGFVAHRAFSKAAMGSDKTVIDTVANIVSQRERAILKAEKTRVARAEWELAVDNPNDDFWDAIDPEADPDIRRETLIAMGMDEAKADTIADRPRIRRKDKRTGMVVWVPNPLLANDPMVFPVRINGQDKFLLFNQKNERARNVAAALKNLDPEKLGALAELSGKFSRFFAAINTQWNVIFGVVNLVRDTGSAMANLSTTPIKGMQGAVLKNLPAALLGVYNATRDRRAGRIPTGAWASRYEEFQRLGGKTGFRDMFENSAERKANLDKELRAVKNEGLWNSLGGRALFAWIGDYNDAMENSVRLSAWHAAVSSGKMTPEAAAIMAKNLTVNFNKKGRWATNAGAFYAFFNASMQGTARLYETVTGPKGKVIIGGGLALGAMQAMMLAAAGFKEGEPPEFIKQRNLVVPNAASDKGYFLIPLPLGLHVIPNITRMAFEYANSGFKDAPRRVTDFMGLVADAFNPIGNAGLSMQTVTPTVFDPIAALIENRDFANRPIAREDFNSLKPTPGFTRSKDTASWIGRYLSEAMNTLTGGTKYTPGVFSPTPDQIDYLAGQLGGGVAREILKSQSVARAQVTGEDIPWYKVPLVGRFYGENKGAPVESARFYENVKSLNLLNAEIKGRNKDGISTTEFMRDNPEYQAYGQATAVQREVSNLRKIKRGLIEKDADPQKVKVIENQIVAAMARLNQRVETLQEKRQ